MKTRKTEHHRLRSLAIPPTPAIEMTRSFGAGLGKGHDSLAGPAQNHAGADALRFS